MSPSSSKSLTIVIPDDIGGSYAVSPHLAKLKNFGSVRIFGEKPADANALADRIQLADAVVSFRPAFTRFPLAVLERCKALRVLSISGTGIGDVDVAAASIAGIAVANVPGPSNRSVAEHCLGLMLDVSHNITKQDRAIRSGEWTSCQGFELGGLTLGLVGLGGIGKELARMATGIGMNVLSWSRGNDPQRAAAVGATAVTLDELLVRSDVVSLHMTLSPETDRFVGPDFFGRMKPGSIFINTARGGLVDPGALVEALVSGHLAGAGLDVFHAEPLPGDDPLRGLRNVVMTPVSAWNTSDAADRMIGVSIENVVKFLSGTPQNVCNPTNQHRKS